MKSPKFTYKLEPKQTGLAAIGNGAQSADIKLNKQIVGLIAAPNWMSKDGLYSARFMVYDPTIECGWRWITLKKRTKTMQEMREWLNQYVETITTTYNLRPSDKE